VPTHLSDTRLLPRFLVWLAMKVATPADDRTSSARRRRSAGSRGGRSFSGGLSGGGRGWQRLSVPQPWQQRQQRSEDTDGVMVKVKKRKVQGVFYRLPGVHFYNSTIFMSYVTPNIMIIYFNVVDTARGYILWQYVLVLW
jgi:hypothetical protein